MKFLKKIIKLILQKINYKIVKIDYEKNQLFVKGSVPGPNNAIITIHR